MGNHEIGKNHQLRSSNIKHKTWDLPHQQITYRKKTTFNHIVAVMARNHLYKVLLWLVTSKKAAFVGWVNWPICRPCKKMLESRMWLVRGRWLESYPRHPKSSNHTSWGLAFGYVWMLYLVSPTTEPHQVWCLGDITRTLGIQSSSENGNRTFASGNEHFTSEIPMNHFASSSWIVLSPWVFWLDMEFVHSLSTHNAHTHTC